MRNFSFSALAFAVLSIAACAPKTTVCLSVPEAPDSEIVVGTDTLRTDAEGKLTLTPEIAEGQPEFIFFFRGDRKIASVLASRGEHISVKADTLGVYEVSGSPESEKLVEVERAFSRFLWDISNETQYSGFIDKYVKYYRSRVQYLMENPYSLTSVQVLYQKIGEYAPIFSQTSDAVHFRRICDSLKTVYPESKYVKALERETQRREQALEMDSRLKNAVECGFPDIVLPDMTGKKTALSGLQDKVILLHFWDCSDAAQTMLNTESLLPVYRDWHDRGFEIYSVCLTPDKAAWGNVVRNQKLPWINVNDGNGAVVAARTYAVASLPSSILIADGNVISASINGEAGLRKELSRLLK